jgi:hypothetical protein
MYQHVLVLVNGISVTEKKVANNLFSVEGTLPGDSSMTRKGPKGSRL